MKVFKKKLKNISILCIVVVIVIFSVYSVFSIKSEEKEFYQKLAKVYHSKKEFDMIKNLTNFKWDRACSHGTYSPAEEPNSYIVFYSNNSDDEIKIYARSSYYGDLIKEDSYFSFSGISSECSKELANIMPDTKFSVESNEIYPSIKHYWIDFIH